MVSDEYLDYVFYFDEECEGFLNFVADYSKSNFHITESLYLYFQDEFGFNCSLEVEDCLDEVLNELFKGFKFVKIANSLVNTYEDLYLNKKLKNG